MNEFNGTTNESGLKRAFRWACIGAAGVVAASVIAVGLLHAGASGVSAATPAATIETGAEAAASGANGATGYFPDQFAVIYSVDDLAQPHIEAF